MYRERRKAGFSNESVMESVYAESRDNACTPMQWDNSENTGFTDGIPWNKVNILIPVNGRTWSFCCPIIRTIKRNEARMYYVKKTSAQLP